MHVHAADLFTGYFWDSMCVKGRKVLNNGHYFEGTFHDAKDGKVAKPWKGLLHTVRGVKQIENGHAVYLKNAKGLAPYQPNSKHASSSSVHNDILSDYNGSAHQSYENNTP